MNCARTSIFRVAVTAIALACAGATVACSGVPAGFKRVRATELNVASTPPPEASMLDVGVSVGELKDLREGELKKLGTNDDIRESERYFVPYHLKTTLEESNHWGIVRVVPEGHVPDLHVSTSLHRSNGQKLQVHVVAKDGMGRVWLDEKYHADGAADSYLDETSPGGQEAYQDLYNTIANDLSTFAEGISPPESERIREVTRLRFAREMVPEVYDDYLESGPDGTVTVRRLPSKDDPMMERVAKVRDREEMFLDTLDLYYGGFYQSMWEAYVDWRRLNLTEQVALKKIRRRAVARGVGGVLLFAAGLALGISTSSSAAGAAAGAMIVIGSQVVVDGINVSAQAEIHAEAIGELGSSFGAQMRPTVIELEGRQYELTGNVAEQYEEWREILRRVYLEEEGLGVAPGAADM